MISKNIPSSPGAALLRDLALRANRGVQLVAGAAGGFVARPLLADGRVDPAAPDAAPLPLIPAHVVEYGAGFLRHVWRARGTSALWWLYVHPRQARWWAYCPPQLCAERDVTVDASFRGCDTPDPELWLAGSLRSAPPGVDVDDVVAAGPLLPAHHGVHLVLALGRPLTTIAAYARTDVGVRAVAAGDLIDDPLDPSLAYLSDRLMFRTRAAT